MWIQFLFSLLIVTAAALLIRALVIERRVIEARALTVLEHIALATAVALALLPSLALIVVPVYTGFAERVAENGGHVGTSAASGTLMETNGPWALLPVVLPFAITAMPLTVRASRHRRSITRVAAVLLTVFVVQGSFSIGLLYLPSAVALWVAALGARPGERTA